MSEKILKVVVSSIPTIIIIVCVAAAFATHDWNVQATVLGDQPTKVLERLLPGELTSEEELFEVTDFKLSEDRTKLILDAVFHSPLNLPVTIKEMQAEFGIDGSIVVLHLPSEITVPARGSASLALEGPLPAVQSPPTHLSVENLTPRSMRMRLEVGGIEIKLENSGLGGAG